MKLKGILGTLFLTLLFVSGANAQDSTATEIDDCKKNRSYYFQYLKQEMYRDAAGFWTKALEQCGTDGIDGKFFSNGRYMYTKLAKEEKDEARVLEIEDTINKIYEWRMAIERDPKWELDYASRLVSDKSDDFAKMDSLFLNIHVLKSDAKSTHIKQYFKHLIINKFNGAAAEDKEEARTFVIEEYIVLSEYVGEALKKAKTEENANEVKRQESAQNFLDKYFLKIAKDCTVLEDVFNKKLNTLPADAETKKKKVKDYLALMDQKDCQTSDVYGNFVDTLIALEPTADAYYFGASYALGKDDYKKADSYLEKAIELEGDGENVNKYLIQLATVQYKQKSYRSAFGTAKKVGGEYRGDALVICANSIAATANGCGETTFARKANFWLANDYIRKAIAAGATGVSSSQFLSNAPSSNEAFAEGVAAGSSFSLTCWGESTTVRF